MTTASDIIACARQFLGVRFAHQGRTPEGLDCLGLLIVTAQAAGVTIAGEEVSSVDIPHYGNRPDVQLLRKKLDGHLLSIDRSAVCEGDVVLLKVDGLPQHLALITNYPMVGELGMIHAYAPARCVVEHRYDEHWRQQTYAAYRLPDILAVKS